MTSPADAATALRQWSTSSRHWLAAILLFWLLALVGGIIMLGLAALLAQLLLWGPISSGLYRWRAVRDGSAAQAEARPVLIMLFLYQLVSLLYLAWLWLNLVNVDLNIH